MSVHEIVTFPDHRLRAPTKRIERVNEEVILLAEDLMDTMYAMEGVGIAAIQIGRPEKMFLIDGVPTGQGQNPLVFINPKIVETSKEYVNMEEGCLSFPGVYINVRRPTSVIMKALDINGEEFVVEADGLFARALLHENDHLTGRLLVDMANFIQQKRIRKRFR